MNFQLQIVTPDGMRFDGQAVCVTVPSIDGQISVLARHINYVTALGMGTAKVTTEEGERYAACIGGMLTVTNGIVRVVATTFEWADEIDTNRAQVSMEKAQAVMDDSAADDKARQAANARMKRARVRLSAAKRA